MCSTKRLFQSSDGVGMSVAKLEHTMCVWPLCCAVTWCFFCFCFLNREEDKNIFDYCRENNIDYVTKAIRSKKVDVNVTDEEVWRKKKIKTIDLLTVLCINWVPLLFRIPWSGLLGTTTVGQTLGH